MFIGWHTRQVGRVLKGLDLITMTLTFNSEIIKFAKSSKKTLRIIKISFKPIKTLPVYPKAPVTLLNYT